MAQWREVAGYEGLYLVSDEGQIFSLPKTVNNGRGEYVRGGKILSVGFRGKGDIVYGFVVLTKDGENKSHSVHRLVAEAFLEKPDGCDVVNHKDRNTLNNKAKNLEWCNQQYNNEYSHNKKVCQLYDGVKVAEYKSISFASKITGIRRTSINNALMGWSETAGGYEWKYCE
jgi:hypothetical protein